MPRHRWTVIRTQWSHRRLGSSNFLFFWHRFYCPPDKVLVIAGTMWSSAFTEIFFPPQRLSAGGCLWMCGNCCSIFITRVPPPTLQPKTAVSPVLLAHVWDGSGFRALSKKIIGTAGCPLEDVKRGENMEMWYSYSVSFLKRQKNCILLEHRLHPCDMRLTYNANFADFKTSPFTAQGLADITHICS